MARRISRQYSHNIHKAIAAMSTLNELAHTIYNAIASHEHSHPNTYGRHGPPPAGGSRRVLTVSRQNTSDTRGHAAVRTRRKDRAKDTRTVALTAGNAARHASGPCLNTSKKTRKTEERLAMPR